MNAALRPPSPAAIVLLTLVGLGLRAFHMNAQSLWYMASAVAYYYRGPARVVGYPPEPARSLSLAAAEEILALASGHPHVWLILSRTFHGDRTGVLAHVLGSHLTPDRELRFDGILAERFATR